MKFRAYRALARAVVIESLRRKDLYVVAILGAIIMAAAGALGFFGFEGLEAFAKDLAVTVLGLFSTIITVLVACRLIPEEIRNRTLYPLLARPISRFDFLFGKYLGAVAVSWLSFFILVTLTSVALLIFGVHFELIMLQYFLAKMMGLAVLCAVSITLSIYMTPAAAATMSFVLAFGSSMIVRALVMGSETNPGLIPAYKALNWVLPQYSLFDMGGRVAKPELGDGSGLGFRRTCGLRPGLQFRHYGLGLVQAEEPSPMMVRLGALAVLLLAGAGTERITALRETSSPPAGLEAHETHGATSLLGQFRTSVSSWLWLRTDLYLHNGVEMRPMTKAETESGKKAEAPHHDDHDAIASEEKSVSVIPDAEHDFRGVFGDIERATTAYQDMHEHRHNEPKVALPLFRLMTWIDPEFIPGWIAGASIMKPKQALAYLDEGNAANPKSIAILSDMGRLYAAKEHNISAAIARLEEARKIATQLKTLSEDDHETVTATYRWLCLCYRELAKFSEMRATALEGLGVFPEDAILRRCAAKPPLVLSQEGMMLWYQGK